MSAALVNPLGDALEGGEAGHVVHEDDGVDAAVVVLHHALPETLLTCSVPDLQLAQQKPDTDMTTLYSKEKAGVIFVLLSANFQTMCYLSILPDKSVTILERVRFREKIFGFIFEKD